MPPHKNFKRKKRLTELQERFVAEFVAGGLKDKQAAAIRAGYSARSANSKACNLVKDPLVKAELERRTKKVLNKLEVTAEYVIGGIVDTIERCKQAKPVVDRQGNPVAVETPDGATAPAYTFEPNACLKGYELLGKHLELFTDKLRVKTDDVNQRSDEELRFYEEHGFWPEQASAGNA